MVGRQAGEKGKGKNGEDKGDVRSRKVYLETHKSCRLQNKMRVLCIRIVILVHGVNCTCVDHAEPGIFYQVKLMTLSLSWALVRLFASYC